MDGNGADNGPAETVASEITAAGGEAVADTHDVSSVGGGAELVSHALSAFGRIDIVITNAGIMQWAGPPEVDAATMQRHLDVHVLGSFNPVRAAWPHFEAQGYGRIVMTTSSGVFGLANNTAYATAKGGVIGLMRSLAVAGTATGITINAIAPAAMTRMAGHGTEQMAKQMDPALVAPMAAYLAHESCPVTGEIYAAGAGRFARIFIATTQGYVHDGPAPAIEDIAACWDAVNDASGAVVPTDLMSWSAGFLTHLDH